MRQILHLVILNVENGSVLAARFGSRWLLPVLAAPERVRADPLARQWASTRGLGCDVVGQWLGRVTPQACDWLMVLNLTASAGAGDSALQWTRIDALHSTDALLEYQGWALERSLEHSALPAATGPFGRVDWIDDAKQWIGAAVGATCDRVMPYRSGAHEVVLRASTALGDVYFKGLARGRAGEARLTQALAAIAPRLFAPTLSLEERADGSAWWLSAACPGRPATDGLQVARALAFVQQRAMASAAVRRELRSLDLEGVRRWATGLVEDRACVDRIEEHIDAATRAAVPGSWIPMDLHPTNVLVDEGDNVRFIDLDDSFLGPAPLAIALFANRSGNRSSYELYEQSWVPPLTDVNWPAFEATTTLIEAWLGWQRVQRHMQHGELYDALHLAETRIRERLVHSLQRR